MNRRRAWPLAVALLLVAVARAGEQELEQARAAAQSGHTGEAIAVLEQLLEREPENVEARVEYARVLSWAGRYHESLRAYELALALEPGNHEAQLGRARVLYWTGRLNAAARMLRTLDTEEAWLLLAQVERARGHNDRALAMAGTLGTEGARLRESIRRELRPELRLQYGVEDDRELPESGTASTMRAARALSSLEFNLHPDLRLRLTGMMTQGSTSGAGGAMYGARAVAIATLAEIKFRPAHWLEMNLGGGWGSTGGAAAAANSNRHGQFLYLFHPVVRWRGLRLDLAFTRSLGDYTPLAIHNSLVEERQTVAASYAWKRWKLGGEYWHAGYSLQSPDTGTPWQTDANGGAAFVKRVLVRGERMLLEAGARYEAYAFDQSAALIPNPGFFTPRSYQMGGGTGHFWWRPHRRLEAEFNGLLGRKRFFLFDNSGPHGFDLTGAMDAKLTLSLGRVRPYLFYAYTSAPSAAAVGTAEQYKVHAFGGGVSIRF